jgi:hypothetical protein
MVIFMATREERIASLAATLKASGIARFDSQARMMAEDMVGVEDNVTKRFDAEHQRAREFVDTSKHLGNPRVSPPTQPASEPPPKPNVLIQPIKTVERHEDKPREEIKTDELGNKSLKDLMFEQIKQDGHEIKNIEELKPSELVETTPQPVVDTPKPVEPVNTATIAEPEGKLDSQKLVELMEEDGKLEEHTREIKEKPKNVKPKEEYAENNIDLSSMFNVNKK